MENVFVTGIRMIIIAKTPIIRNNVALPLSVNLLPLFVKYFTN
jgi:hypothetical protein